MNRKTIKDDIELDMPYFKDHALFPVIDDHASKIVGWYVRPSDGGRDRSFLVLAHPEGVSLHGDMVPGPSISSCLGAPKDLSWFASRHEHDYLASKFLSKGWCASKAEQHIKDLIDEYEEELCSSRRVIAEEYADPIARACCADAEQADSLEDFISALREAAANTSWDEQSYSDSFYVLLDDYGYDSTEIMPGYDYLHEDVIWLVCMQRTFARLYHEKYTPKEEAALEADDSRR